jgi:hypothetical protein
MVLTERCTCCSIKSQNLNDRGTEEHPKPNLIVWQTGADILAQLGRWVKQSLTKMSHPKIAHNIVNRTIWSIHLFWPEISLALTNVAIKTSKSISKYFDIDFFAC